MKRIFLAIIIGALSVVNLNAEDVVTPQEIYDDYIKSKKTLKLYDKPPKIKIYLRFVTKRLFVQTMFVPEINSICSRFYENREVASPISCKTLKELKVDEHE